MNTESKPKINQTNKMTLEPVKKNKERLIVKVNK